MVFSPIIFLSFSRFSVFKSVTLLANGHTIVIYVNYLLWPFLPLDSRFPSGSHSPLYTSLRAPITFTTQVLRMKGMAVNCNLNYGGSFHIGCKHTLIGLLRSFYESAQEVTAKFPFQSVL